MGSRKSRGSKRKRSRRWGRREEEESRGSKRKRNRRWGRRGRRSRNGREQEKGDQHDEEEEE